MCCVDQSNSTVIFACPYTPKMLIIYLKRSNQLVRCSLIFNIYILYFVVVDRYLSLCNSLQIAYIKLNNSLFVLFIIWFQNVSVYLPISLYVIVNIQQIPQFRKYGSQEDALAQVCLSMCRVVYRLATQQVIRYLTQCPLATQQVIRYTTYCPLATQQVIRYTTYCHLAAQQVIKYLTFCPPRVS